MQPPLLKDGAAKKKKLYTALHLHLHRCRCTTLHFKYNSSLMHTVEFSFVALYCWTGQAATTAFLCRINNTCIGERICLAKVGITWKSDLSWTCQHLSSVNNYTVFHQRKVTHVTQCITSTIKSFNLAFDLKAKQAPTIPTFHCSTSQVAQHTLQIVQCSGALGKVKWWGIEG